MPVDYSKWDALELSDDSDIEVHPNVDKRSFIRAKQNQIHQQRHERKGRIATLRYERIINEGLLGRIGALVKTLEEQKGRYEDGKAGDEVDEGVFEALVEVTSDASLGEDSPPRAPEGVHKNEQQPKYSQMLGALVDQVKLEVDRCKTQGPARHEAYVKEVQSHLEKVQGLQKDLEVELRRLEKEEGEKITSDSIHDGFSISQVSKEKASVVQAELLNPKRTPAGDGNAMSGAEADVEDGDVDVVPGEDVEEDIQASPTARKFGKIPYGDYTASFQFIVSNPQILVEKETDGLLVEAFNAQSSASSKKDEEYARTCVHQALLLQYCRQLGKDGVRLFFQRVQTSGHKARKLFLDDVNSTYARIRTRTAELKKESEEEGGDREQIQLHAVDPGTSINIITPPAMAQCTTDDERAAREIFDTFPPGLQRALESGSLDRVNEVLGKMSVSEAEIVVDQLGGAGMLSMEEGVIDATTEEGKKVIEEIERAKKMPGRVEEVDESMEGQTGAGAGEVKREEEREVLMVDEVD
ncbi:hypothetical protein B0A48_15775 [Cryoendolithus antarcticus]|uniref:Hsp90 chaperone protein kinase-targeting subunit n=1 Tax=Cryoendolithus antarcticus TaxID=1507870 RepID=A0A1V8SH89_9PEZI|nr:hypothetical protein B0A48_15775 [Cryoendolithus antarcticus]